MKHNPECNPGPQKQPAAHQRLHSFCSSYNILEAEELLCRVFIAMLEGNYSLQSMHSRERLLVYFEALEDVLPVLYELQEQLNGAEKQEGEEDFYTDQVSAKDLFASFKRHPE